MKNTQHNNVESPKNLLIYFLFFSSGIKILCKLFKCFNYSPDVGKLRSTFCVARRVATRTHIVHIMNPC